ncbi:transposase [Marichromatium gracile]|uniref:transposase n=1 Tax=Marichromatium gracile TaxID=1048 RepID=UPI001F28C350|nr:transposase [Marichromatium gracile]MCF1184557.1 transposase [Marichromatium gracile]
MSFWDKAFQVAKDVGTSAANSLNEKANEIRQIKEKYESMSDEDLIRIANSDGFFGNSSTEKGVAFSTLKRRGYSPEDIRAHKA